MAPSQHATLILHVGLVADPGAHAGALRALHDLLGVRHVDADTVTGAYRVGYDPTLTSMSALVGCLTAHGLPPGRAQVLDEDPSNASG
jgi:hypothetical protein